MRGKIKSGTNRLQKLSINSPSVSRPFVQQRVQFPISVNAAGPKQAVPANTGDHPLLQQFLERVQIVKTADFQQSLDSPTYEPRDRLLLRDRGEIIAHVRVVQRLLRFGRSVLPSFHLVEFAASPEYRSAVCLRMLLAAVRQRAAADRIALMTAAFGDDELNNRMGWQRFVSGADVTTSPQSLLAAIQTIEANQRTNFAKRFHVRPLRFVDLPSIERLFVERSTSCWGMPERSREDWLWLLSRRGFDRGYVVTTRSSDHAQDDRASEIIGYCLQRNNQVVELVADPNHPLASSALLRQAGKDVLERGVHSITVVGESLSNDLRSLLGTPIESPRFTFACVQSPRYWLKGVSAELAHRAVVNGVPFGCQFGLTSGTETISVELTESGLRISVRGKDRSRVRIAPDLMTRLALESVDLDRVPTSEFAATTQMARIMATRYFSGYRFVQPLLDDLPTLE